MTSEPMKGKVVVITGATSGIGKAMAMELVKKGATITLTTRDMGRGQAVKAEMLEVSGNPNVEVLLCDLASFDSIRNFCKAFLSKHDELHVLVNNAGIWDFDRRISHDGIERIFAVNFLAPFLMTDLLLGRMKESAPSRIVNVGSALHGGTVQFEDIEFSSGFSGFRAYRQSKLALLLYTRLLAKKLEGTGVTVNCVAPGMVNTNLARDAGPMMRGMFRLLGKSPEKGARTPLYVTSSPGVVNMTGEYFSNMKVKRSSKESYDMELAARLWRVGEGYLKRAGH